MATLKEIESKIKMAGDPRAVASKALSDAINSAGRAKTELTRAIASVEQAEKAGGFLVLGLKTEIRNTIADISSLMVKINDEAESN